MLCRRNFIKIINICLMYNYRVYNNLSWIFLIQMEYRLQSMCNHMVGLAASVVSPFYSVFLGLCLSFTFHYLMHVHFTVYTLYTLQCIHCTQWFNDAVLLPASFYFRTQFYQLNRYFALFPFFTSLSVYAFRMKPSEETKHI